MAVDTVLTSGHPTVPDPDDDVEPDAEVHAEVEEEVEEEVGEDVPERVARALSAAFRAALPYVVGIRAMKSLATGTWFIVKNTVVWIIDGNALEIFAPGIVRKRKAKAAAQTALAKGKGKGKAVLDEPKSQGSGDSRLPVKTDEVKERTSQKQPLQIEGKELPAPVLRLGGLLFGGFLVVYHMPHNPAIWMPAVLVPWATAAWVYAPVTEPKADKPKQEQQSDEKDEGGHFEEDEYLEEDGPLKAGESGEQESGERRVLSAEEIEARFWLYVENTVAVRYAEGVRGIRQGVHVEDMVAELKEKKLISDPAWDTAALASYFRRIGIPLRDPLPLTVRGKKRNRIGVDFKELTRTLGREPRRPPHLAVDRTPQEDPLPGPPGGAPGAGPDPSQGVREGERTTPAEDSPRMAG
ncbi:hypothetical protein ACFC58_06735 [Kitasatospora purpeofusca]|uniref:hypothetical protein n=1 Tax=Kitasatospora purpeofusca TaxID=67352 RepID=UPI0035DD9F91